MHTALCFCDRLPRIETRINPVWLLHCREQYQTTNTGFLIGSCVPGTQRILYQPGPDVVDVEPLLSTRQNIAILFPGEGAQELSPEAANTPGGLTLVVPDGTWRRASRMVRRDPYLRTLPRYTLPIGDPSVYTLRRATHTAGLSTLEAFAHAVGIVDGPEPRAQLLEVLREFQDGSFRMKGMRWAVTPKTARLPRKQWESQEAEHHRRIEGLIGPYMRTRAAGEENPVLDFLFEYYAFRPAKLRRWDPGHGVQLLEANEFLDRKDYIRVGDGVMLDPDRFPARRVKALRWMVGLLAGTESRPPHFSCNGMHEWAMCFEAGAEVRHADWPLRLSPSALDMFVRSWPITCTHFDAFRFFTPAARPLNEVEPTMETMADLEQPGCLHTNMDLYRWAHKLHPWIGSDLVADAFEVAVHARTIDMRASPYDLRGLGLEPICIETPAGQNEYRRHQSELAARAAPVRRRLLMACRRLLGWVKVP
jgi:DTW domain-containing protein YfiP